MIRSPIKRATPIKPSGRRMKSGHSTGRPTKAQASRFERMRELGCIACRIGRSIGIPTAMFGSNGLEIHHLLSGGRRIGHDATICLCHYHHQAKFLMFPDQGYCAHALIFGPSLEHEPNAFRMVYGREDAQLAYQNALLAGDKA